jgi:hypothetical protein
MELAEECQDVGTNSRAVGLRRLYRVVHTRLGTIGLHGKLPTAVLLRRVVQRPYLPRLRVQHPTE